MKKNVLICLLGSLLMLPNVFPTPIVWAETTTINVKDFGANGADSKDDTQALKKTLNDAQYNDHTTVIIPAGKYYVTQPLRIRSHTHLKLAKDAVIIRNAAYSPMIMNHTSGAPGYSANENITIEGGTWDGNGDRFPTPFDNILIGHATDIVVKNARILDNYEGHQVEFAGVKNGQVINNYIEGYDGVKKKEAIQLDVTHDNLIFPPFGEYDDTPCLNILIEGNTIVRHSRGIGSHTMVYGVYHDQIIIRNNTFTDLAFEGINALSYKNMTIEDNTFTDIGVAIEVQTISLADPTANYDPVEPPIGPAPAKFNIDIINNTINRTHAKPLANGDAINVMGDKEYPLNDVTITGNQMNQCANYGIYLANTSDSLIKNNRISQCKGGGIGSHYQSRGNLIEGNDISGSGGHGISVFSYATATIRQNNIQNSKKNGIALGEFANNNLVVNNNISQSNENGIGLFQAASNNTLENNRIDTSKKQGISIFQQSSATVRNNLVLNSGTHAIAISNRSDNSLVTRNSIQNANSKGIMLLGDDKQSVQRTTVADNTLTGVKSDGIYLEYASNNTISGNRIQSPGSSGVVLSRKAQKNLIQKNQITSSKKFGIQVYDRSSATISDNSIRSTAQNGVSISLQSTGNVIQNNTISNNGKHGISIFDRSAATIRNNSINQSNQSGISISQQSNSSSITGNTITASKIFGICPSNQSKIGTLSKNNITKSGRKSMCVSN